MCPLYVQSPPPSLRHAPNPDAFPTGVRLTQETLQRHTRLVSDLGSELAFSAEVLAPGVFGRGEPPLQCDARVQPSMVQRGPAAACDAASSRCLRSRRSCTRTRTVFTVRPSSSPTWCGLDENPRLKRSRRCGRMCTPETELEQWVAAMALLIA